MNIEGKDKVFFGKRLEDGAAIYISKPTFDCNHYWSFGYLGNKNEHYHLSGYQNQNVVAYDKEGKFKSFVEKRNINMVDALEKDYDLDTHIKENIWEFCELALSIETLKKSAALFQTGGSNLTSNPIRETLKVKSQVDLINKDLLPKQLQAFWDIATNNLDLKQKNEKKSKSKNRP
jgi:hypothetical protein